MKNILVILFILGLVICYGVKFQKQINTLKHNQMMFEQSVDCMKYLQENNKGICD